MQGLKTLLEGALIKSSQKVRSKLTILISVNHLLNEVIPTIYGRYHSSEDKNEVGKAIMELGRNSTY